MHHALGSGTIYLKDNNKFTKELLDRSIKTQKEMIKKAIKILKPGGELTYSTCSILKEENENVIKEIINHPNIDLISIDEKMFKGIKLLPVNIKGTICICPTNLYEGFFIAKLKKLK